MFRQQPHQRRRLSTTTPTTTLVLKALEVEATWEVIGGSGRMGSLFLREHGAIAVPRGVRPGCLSSSSSSSSSNSTHKATLAAAATDDDEHVITKVLTETQTIAIIGASRNAQRPSNSVMQFLLDEGYTVIPINPGLAGNEIHGQTVYGTLSQYYAAANNSTTASSPQTGIDMIDIFRNSEAVPGIVDEVLDLNGRHPQQIKSIWMQQGVQNEEAYAHATDAGVEVIMKNLCPKIEIPKWNILTPTRLKVQQQQQQQPLPPSIARSSSAPIIVAIPAREWKQTYEVTVPPRRSDLVWVGNGLVSASWQRPSTIVVPHFGVLAVGAEPTTSATSPPTYVFGTHARSLQAILRQRGIRTVVVVDSWTEICQHAAWKLLWASCLWLLCHDTNTNTNDGVPLTLQEVHEQKQEELKRLVKELLPNFLRVLAVSESDDTDYDNPSCPVVTTTTRMDAFELDTILAYMKAYSLSMPQAICSKSLAMQELHERNGIWFTDDQSFHRELLERVAGSEAVERLLDEQDQQRRNTLSGKTTNAKLITIPAIDLELVCHGQENSTSRSVDRQIQSAIVVGGGIIGSSIARALTQRGMEVTVYDPTPTGTTTPASWAWLNANQKPPHSYKSLNQLGLRGWRSDPVLSSFPFWTGTLVRTKEKLELNGGYSAEGPLDINRIRELEPEANFNTINETITTGYVYYFADEGHVNPHEAVLALRQEAAKNGATFVIGERVVDLVRNNDNKVVGVKVVPSISSQEDDDVCMTEKLADVVIVAAGASSSDKALGGVPLQHNPSRTYFASPRTSTVPSSPMVTLMDMVRGLYVAQRTDGTLVVGGGAVKYPSSHEPEEVQKQITEAQKISQRLAPNPIARSNFTHMEEVIKPMPEDGFPILGYLEPGLYSAVTHSGMTLAPLIGQLVAAEVQEQVSLRLLDDYRPTRFNA